MDEALFTALLNKPRPREFVDIVLDKEWADRINAVTAALRRAEAAAAGAGIASDLKSRKEAEKRVETLRAELAELRAEPNKVVRFVCVAMPRVVYEQLLREHQPTKEQRKANPQALANDETLIPAFIAESLRYVGPPPADGEDVELSDEPVLTPEQVRRLLDEWDAADAARLRVCAESANTRPLTVSL